MLPCIPRQRDSIYCQSPLKKKYIFTLAILPTGVCRDLALGGMKAKCYLLVDICAGLNFLIRLPLKRRHILASVIALAQMKRLPALHSVRVFLLFVIDCSSSGSPVFLLLLSEELVCQHTKPMQPSTFIELQPQGGRGLVPSYQ